MMQWPSAIITYPHVLADTRPVSKDIDIMSCQCSFGANAGYHKQLWRTKLRVVRDDYALHNDQNHFDLPFRRRL